MSIVEKYLSSKMSYEIGKGIYMVNVRFPSLSFFGFPSVHIRVTIYIPRTASWRTRKPYVFVGR